MEKKMIHNPSEAEKNQYKAEMDILECYRAAFREDVRQIIREEWGEHINNRKEITVINFWLGRITIIGKPVYLSSIALLGIILYILL